MFDPDRLSPAERLLWDAVPRGLPVRLGTGDPDAERTVRADVLAALLNGARPPEPGHHPILRLGGAIVQGHLCLCGGTIGCDLSLDACEFEAPLCIAGLTAHGIRITSCRLPSLDGSGLTAGRLELDHSEATGGVHLSGARITGALSLHGANLQPDAKGTALEARDLFVDGPLRLDRLRAAGGITLSGCQVGGSVGLDGAVVDAVGDTAVDLDRAVVGGRLTARGLTANGQVKLRNAMVGGSVQMARADLRAAGGVALSAGGLTARGGLWLNAGFTAAGEIRLVGARLQANLALDGAVLTATAGTALNLDRIEVSEIDCTELTVTEGLVSMAGGRLGSQLVLDRARLGGGLDLRRVQVEALVLRPADVTGAVRLDNAQVGVLSDDPAHWPGHLNIDGLSYRTLDPALPAPARLRWLALDPGPPRSQPFEELAEFYRRSGAPAQARRVLHAKEQGQMRARPWLTRIWCELQDLTVGYGYRPWRALLWLALLILLGAVVYTAAPPAALKRDEAPHFNPVAYTVDLLLPVVDLGQEHAFDPVGLTQWFSYLLVAAGWVLVSTVAAGAARTVIR